jgi:hypothetical protein
MDEQVTVGIVREGRFITLPAKQEVRLTRIAMQAATSPTAGEVDLKPFEGNLLAVEGHAGDEWIYSANVVDRAGKTMAAAVAEMIEKAAPPEREERDASRTSTKGKKRVGEDVARATPGVIVEEGFPSEGRSTAE